MHTMDGGDYAQCADGVTIDLDRVAVEYEQYLPITITVCFDKSCDAVDVYREGRDWVCDGHKGGAPDQWTYCGVAQDGTVSFAIERIDGADYSDGRSHVLGVSVQSEGTLLYTDAQEVVMEAMGPSESCCYQSGVEFEP